MFAAFALCLGLLCTAAAQPYAYQIHTTGSLDLLVPRGGQADETIYFRDASGDWRPADARKTDGAVAVSIYAEQLDGGQTILLFGRPAHVNLDDSRPPEIVSLRVDGKTYSPATDLDLGGVGAAPEEIRVEVRDEKNALRRKSLFVSINGRRYDVRTPGVEFERTGTRSAVITVNPRRALDTLSRSNHVMIGIDDYAIDDEALTFTVSFDYVEGHRMEDGTVVSVDSVTDSSGWQDWTVVLDGKVMDTDSGTTAGKTWLSEENAHPHWIKMEFPEAREVSKVKLWWAHYQMFRTSRAYEIQTWNGEKWVTQVKVEDQTPRQVSEHEFEPVSTTAVRVWQPPHSGQAQRADYMWLAEIKIE